MRKTLIAIDPERPVESLELLGIMHEMYGSGGSTSFAMCLGSADQEILEAVDHVIEIDKRLGAYDVIALTGCIEELHARHRFDAILIPASTFGTMLAPRTAMRLHVGLVADVTGIRHRKGEIEMVRPAFSGRMLAGIVNRGRIPVMMTVRQNVFSRPDDDRRSRSAQVERLSPRKVENSGIRLTGVRPKPVSEDIRESEVLVSGGGGVARSFTQLESLATALGGKVSASRKVVDSGTAPRHVQVGQSGKTVSPRLYVAVGISGAIQHIVGLSNAECIIAVNSDRHAPICALSDIVVECDARDFIPRMVRRIETERTAAFNAKQGDKR